MQDLKAQLKQLEEQATALQIETAKTEFQLEFEDMTTVNKILNTIDKDYQWNSKNAALTAYVYDALKAERMRLIQDGFKAEDKVTVTLKATELNALYNIMLNITGQGVEKARSFARLLTNIGQQVSEAMMELAKKNEATQKLHTQMMELEQQIEALEFEQQDQSTTNEVSQQIEEAAANS